MVEVKVMPEQTAFFSLAEWCYPCDQPTFQSCYQEFGPTAMGNSYINVTEVEASGVFLFFHVSPHPPPPLKSLIDCASRPWTTVTIVSLKLQMYLVHRQRAQIRNTELLSFHTRILAHVSHVNLLLKKTFTGGRDLSFSVYTWRKLLNSSSRHSKTLVAKEPQ